MSGDEAGDVGLESLLLLPLLLLLLLLFLLLLLSWSLGVER
jgi:hypothetical protein